MAAKKVLMKEFDLDKIHWEGRFRDDLGNIEGLCESIREKGIIQPITVTADGRLLAGERRVTAARTIGLTKIPAIIRESADEADDREIELYENVFRKDFAWDEQIKLIAEIDKLNKAKNCDWSNRKTAQLLGYSQPDMMRKMQLNSMIEAAPEIVTQFKNESEAYKFLKKLEEEHVTEILRSRQEEHVDKPGFDFLRMAKANYRLGDCFKGMSEFRSDGMVDFIECDPPYGIALNEMKRKELAFDKVSSYQEIPLTEYPEFIKDLAEESYRIASKSCWMIMWYGMSNHQLVLNTLRAAKWEVAELPGIWVKPNGQTMQPNINLANCYEPFFICRKGTPFLAKQGRSNVFTFSPTAGQKKYHPTERPIELMREILTVFNTVRSTVIVPCLGSGVTLRACYLEGMTCAGWDLNGEYKDKFLLAVEADLADLNKGD